MLSGVLPIISFASSPTALTRLMPFSVSTATTDGSFSTMPLPRTYTTVFAVPRSIAMSWELNLNQREKKDIRYSSCHRQRGVRTGRTTVVINCSLPSDNRTKSGGDSGSAEVGGLDRKIRLCGWVAICVRLR